MSAYPPPTYFTPIFSSNEFPTNTTTTGITEAQLTAILNGYTQYPTTQGGLTLADSSTATTQSNNDNSTKVATTQYVYNEIISVLTTSVVQYFTTSQTITIPSTYRRFDIVVVGGGGNNGNYQNADSAPLALGGAGGGGGGFQYTGVPIVLATANQINLQIASGGAGGFTKATYYLNGVSGVGLGQGNNGGNGGNATSLTTPTGAGGAGGGYSAGGISTYASANGYLGTAGGSGTLSSNYPISIPSAGVPTIQYGTYGYGGTNPSVEGYFSSGYYSLTGNPSTGGYVKITWYYTA